MKSSFIRVCLAFACMVLVAAFASAGGGQEKKPPQFQAAGDEQWISPAVSPGVKDSLTIPVKIEADAANRMVIKEYRIAISSAQGAVVREWKNKDETKPGFFDGIFIALGFMQKPAVAIPESVVWDGKDGAGAMVPDGLYSLVKEATDDEGKSAKSNPQKIGVKNSPPKAELKFDYLVFAPGSAGSRPFLPIASTSTKEDVWKAAVRSAQGALAAQMEWSGQLPERINWSGADQAGKLLPDGAYTILISSEDKAGNSFSLTSDTIVIDTRPRAFALTLDQAAFSPNGDGVKDLLNVRLDNFVQDRLVSADAAVLDGANRPLRQAAFGAQAPAQFGFDGKADGGGRVPDGSYRIRLAARYENGMEAVAESAPFLVKTNPPKASLTIDSPILNPNGKGRKDTVTISGVFSSEKEWTAVVQDGRGGKMEYSLSGEPPARAVWDGRGPDGQPVPDGTYTGKFFATDAAGNYGESNTISVVVDSRQGSLSLVADELMFSPNGDGLKDSISLRPVTSAGQETESWKAVVRDDKGRIVRTVERKEKIPASLVWDGRTDAGQTAADGMYSSEVQVTYANGSQAVALSPAFQLDSSGKGIASVTPSAEGFSPNGDGVMDSISFAIDIKDSANLSGGGLEMVHESRGSLASLAAPAELKLPLKLTWDGRGAPEGRYTAVLKLKYRNGSEQSFSSKTFRLKTTPPQVRLEVRPQPFSPGLDGADDRLTFTLDVIDDAPMGGWSVSLFDPKGVLFASQSGTGEAPRTGTWDGYSPGGELVRSATDYTAAFTVKDIFGNSASGRTTIAVDVLTYMDGLKRKIRVPNIQFAPNTPEFIRWKAEIGRENTASINTVAAFLKRYPAYRIVLEGHAVSVYFMNKARSEREHREELLPLSRRRAEVIKKALVERGIAANRIDIKEFGGSFPLVPFSDLVKRWINRRVEFILLK
jgi:flagellar hook assembly protein FlgD/outer membrane protein OmpA-like peptidoglycan-associated protein